MHLAAIGVISEIQVILEKYMVDYLGSLGRVATGLAGTRMKSWSLKKPRGP